MSFLPSCCQIFSHCLRLDAHADDDASAGQNALCVGSGRILPNDASDTSLVFHLVLLKEVVSLGLCGRLGIGVVEKVLDTERNLLHRDGRLPTLLLVENRQADGARWVYIRVEQGGRELACG